MEKQAVDILLNVLPTGLGARLQPDGIELSAVPGAPRLMPLWAGEGFPADVRRARAAVEWRPNATRVIVARKLSTGARQLLDDLDESWADRDGRARIVIPGAVYIQFDRGEPGRSQGKSFRWSESAGALAEHLLVQYVRGRPPTGIALDEASTAGAQRKMEIPRTTDLAHSAGLSPAQVSKVLQQFDTQQWTQKTGPERGTGAIRTLRDPSGLLSAWAGWYRRHPQQTIAAHALWQDPIVFWRDRVEPHLRSGSFALTGWMALAQAAPYTTSIPTIACYIDIKMYDHVLAEVMQSAGLRPSEDPGARITFIRVDIDSIDRAQSYGPYPCVNNVRLYGDLLRAGLRGEDAAEHLREERLGI